MTEKTTEVVEEKKEVEVKDDTETTVELSPVEQEALEQGWVPKTKWVEDGGNPDEWRSAKEFKDRGELYKTIHSTKRELKQTQATLTALQKHHQFVFEKAHKQAVADLKQEKRAAMVNEDFDRVEQLDTAIEEAVEEHQKAKQELVQVQVEETGQHPEFTAWVDRNQWYERDEDLRDEADSVGIVYAKKHQGVPPAEVLKAVEKEMKRRHPEKLGVKRAAPNPAAGVDRSNKPVKASGGDDLDEMERDIMRTLVKSGVMTEAEYKAELRKAKQQ